MSSVSEPKRGFPAVLGVFLAIVAALWLGDSLTSPAAAEPSLSRLGASQERPNRESSRLTAHFASHHEEDEEEHDHEEEDLGEELAHLEVERAALETFFGGLELVEKIGKMAADDDLAAVVMLTSVTDEYDMPESKLIDFLKAVAKDSPSKAARRVATMELAGIYNERGDVDAALTEARRILLGGL